MMRTINFTITIRTDATDKQLLELLDAMEAQTEMITDDFGKKMPSTKATISQEFELK